MPTHPNRKITTTNVMTSMLERMNLTAAKSEARAVARRALQLSRNIGIHASNIRNAETPYEDLQSELSSNWTRSDEVVKYGRPKANSTRPATLVAFTTEEDEVAGTVRTAPLPTRNASECGAIAKLYTSCLNDHVHFLQRRQ